MSKLTSNQLPIVDKPHFKNKELLLLENRSCIFHSVFFLFSSSILNNIQQL